MLSYVEDGAARRERVCRALDRAMLGELDVSETRRGSLDVEGAPPPVESRRAAEAARRHLAVLARGVRSLLADDDAPDELCDLGLATVTAARTLRAVWTPHRPARDGGAAGARVARCAAEALRAHATRAAPRGGVPVPDVPDTLLWLICDLSSRLRATGREGPSGRRWDAAAESRDAADLVVTTYRRWRPRLRGSAAETVAGLAVTAARAAVLCGFASIDPDDDDGCGRAVAPASSPPALGATAAASPPGPPATSADQNCPHPAPCTAAVSSGRGSIRGSTRASSSGAKSPVAGSCA